MPIRSHPGRSNTCHRFRRSKKLLCRGHIAALAQHYVHQRASAVNCPVQIAPPAIDFDVGFIDVPRAADSAATSAAAAKIVDQQRREFRLPIPDRLVGEFDTAEKEHLRQIAQAQLVTQSPEDNECDDIGWILGAVQRPTNSFVELLATITATEPPVTLRGAIRPLRSRCPAACDAFHPPCSPSRRNYARAEPSPELPSGVNADGTGAGATLRTEAVAAEASREEPARTLAVSAPSAASLIELAGTTARVQVPLTEEASNRMRTLVANNAPNQVFLRIDDIRYDKSSGVYYEVYVNPLAGEKLDIHATGYVGNLSLFGLKPHAMAGIRSRRPGIFTSSTTFRTWCERR
jgi:hypothetical protein